MKTEFVSLKHMSEGASSLSPPADFESKSRGRRFHIAHVNFAKGFRGGERQTLNLIEGLAQSDLSQTLVCRPDSELHRRAELAGIATKLVVHPIRGHRVVPDADLIHVHEARGIYWAMVEHALRRTPYLVTRRIPNPISGSAMNNAAYKFAAALVGVSCDVASRLKVQTGREVHAILDSCSVTRPNFERVVQLKTKIGGWPIIGHVGALHDHHKGQSTLIAAFQLLTEMYPDARLVLLGDGPDKSLFQSLAMNDPRIVIAGFHEDVGDWISAFDIFAFPSREEGLGSSVLDAMLLGIPVVASTAGGLPELIGNSERGLLVRSHDPRDWMDAIRYLLSNATKRSEFSRNAMSFAATRDSSAMAKEYLNVYRNIITL